MIPRRRFLGLLGLLGLSRFLGARPPFPPPDPPEDAAWDWWRNLPRHALRRSDDPVADALCRAATARRDVTILYAGGSEPGRERRIRPLGVFEVEGYRGIYVRAFCFARNAERTFRIERIAALV